jgi:hypothetical protein
MQTNFLTVEVLREVPAALEMVASYDTEGDWVSADRRVFAQASYGVNIDNALMLDFDEDGYLCAVEILGSRASFDVSDVSIPLSSPNALVRLTEIPQRPGAEQFDCIVNTSATPDGARVQAMIPDVMPGAAWFSLGDMFFAAINDGRLASVLFSLSSPA